MELAPPVPWPTSTHSGPEGVMPPAPPMGVKEMSIACQAVAADAEMADGNAITGLRNSLNHAEQRALFMNLPFMNVEAAVRIIEVGRVTRTSRRSLSNDGDNAAAIGNFAVFVIAWLSERWA